MKRLIIFLSFITLAIANFSCERDDICAETTSTTPRLIVEFYDNDDFEVLKNVPRITAYGEDLFTDLDGTLNEPLEASDKIILTLGSETPPSYVFNINSNKIALPLRIGPENEEITVRYVLEKDTNLRLDTNNTQTSNIDIIEIKYITEFVYVSRACGYKSIFTQLSISSVTDNDPWIANIINDVVTENIVENEDTTHVRIFH
ncbi:DUF6452 family protein [Winogradskyella bathintestinalis]|uniref:DUF6452 family protein n=1 Tax=Winogradskyella bathintestinalis TaxID=3035208 RepID=A0ABT7ZSY2_9FLAO|nr:DUF6452 family protein [Winogradskyella bathintestinalis]MDN3492132.1 DUF6452 family protein [Winogradskyella bathintestinalis]